MIISASRRGDIPAFHFSWFLQRMRAGFVDVANPFNPRQVRRVSLAPRDADCVVFWTKDARPMQKHIAEFEAYGVPYIILYTLTPYGRGIEPGLAGKSGVADSFRKIADRTGAQRLIWRYDPIILTPELTAAWHCRAFSALARRLEGSVRRCIVSFVQPYRRIQKNLAALGREEPDAAAKQELLAALGHIAAGHGIRLQSCADPDTPGCAGACVEAALIARVTGRPVAGDKDKNQRAACLCAVSVDIGSYGTCGHGCLYCYAGGGRNRGR
jgi:hypothetical protein